MRSLATLAIFVAVVHGDSTTTETPADRKPPATTSWFPFGSYTTTGEGAPPTIVNAATTKAGTTGNADAATTTVSGGRQEGRESASDTTTKEVTTTSGNADATTTTESPPSAADTTASGNADTTTGGASTTAAGKLQDRTTTVEVVERNPVTAAKAPNEVNAKAPKAKAPKAPKAKAPKHVKAAKEHKKGKSKKGKAPKSPKVPKGASWSAPAAAGNEGGWPYVGEEGGTLTITVLGKDELPGSDGSNKGSKKEAKEPKAPRVAALKASGTIYLAGDDADPKPESRRHAHSYVFAAAVVGAVVAAVAYMQKANRARVRMQYDTIPEARERHVQTTF